MPDRWSVLAEAARRGALTLDVHALPLISIPWPGLDALPWGQPYRDHLLRVASVKIIADGSPQARTVWLSKPYFVTPPGHDETYAGYRQISDADFQALLTRGADHDWQVFVHVNGDAAIQQLIDCVRAVDARRDKPMVRTIAIHAQTARTDQLHAMKALDIEPVQPPKFSMTPPLAHSPALFASRLREPLARVYVLAPVIALVETAQGLAEARAMARSGRVARFAFGSVDYVADLGCDQAPEALAHARSELVMASRLGRLPLPIDGVTSDLQSAQAVQTDARQARALGFGGKLAIHPAQVPHLRKAFQPSAEDLAWARLVLDSGDGAVRVAGVMVDEPLRIRGRSILARSAG